MRQVSKIFGAVIEAYLAVVLDDLEAVAVELRLMQPGNGLEGRRWGCRGGRT